MRAARATALVLVVCPVLFGSPKRQIPFWPDALPGALQAHIDGAATLETVRDLGRFHRVHGSPGFHEAAESVRSKLAGMGFEDARVEAFPADGQTRYAHVRSYLGWTPVEAALVESSGRLVERFPDLPVALADYSQDADDTLSGRYAPVSIEDVSAYLELLARAKVIRFKN
jgi:hypothetical protein